MSNAGQYPPAAKDYDTFLVTGPMCRFSSDLIPILKVIAGKNVNRLQLDTKVSIVQGSGF